MGVVHLPAGPSSRAEVSPTAGGTSPAPVAAPLSHVVVAPVDQVDLGAATRMFEDPELKGKPYTECLFQGRSWVYDPIVGPDNTVYVGCGDDHLYAFNPDGSMKWKAPVGLVLSAPAVAPDGTVYAGNDDGQLVALNADGTEKWRFKTAYGQVGSATVDAQGDVYFGSGDCHVWAVHADGTRKWAFECQGGVSAPPVVGEDGRVYVGDLFGRLHAFDAADGHEIWGRESYEAFQGPVALGKDGTVLMTRWKSLEALDPATGKTLWSRPAEPGRQAGPAVDADGHVVVAGWDGSLRFYDGQGTEVRRATVSATLATTPRVGPDGMVVVRDTSRRVWAFDHDGNVIWSQGMPDAAKGGSLLTSLDVAADGTVYVGNNDGTLTAMHFRTVAQRRDDAEQAQEMSGGKREPPRIEVGEEWIVIGGVKVPVKRPSGPGRA